MKKAAIYARVSTPDQCVENQLYQLRELSGMSLTQVSKKYGVSRASVVRFTRVAMKGECSQIGEFRPAMVLAPAECIA